MQLKMLFLLMLLILLTEVQQYFYKLTLFKYQTGYYFSKLEYSLSVAPPKCPSYPKRSLQLIVALHEIDVFPLQCISPRTHNSVQEYLDRAECTSTQLPVVLYTERVPAVYSAGLAQGHFSRRFTGSSIRLQSAVPS
jgi:hypothetical protein